MTTASLSHSSTLSSLYPHHHHQSNLGIPSFSVPFFIKILASKLFYYLNNARLVFVQLRVLIFISFPSLYFLLYKAPGFFVPCLVLVLVFSFMSLNSNLPRFPHHPILARLVPYKVNSAPLPSKASNPVVWSIGSKPKSENRPYSGSWVQVYSNGDVYEGEFHKGKCSGSGVYSYCMSGRYEGDWIDEKYDGYGVETWARGSRYRGQYWQGLRHGVGVYRFYTGDVYAGEWSNGQCHGCGIHTCEDGSKYVGEFKWGVKHGLGHYHFRNGDMYAGEYFADKMHGFGVYLFGNGHRYEGAWHEGKRQGLGTYTFRNGEAQSGHWLNGFLNIPCTENKHPGFPCPVSLSKVINAVQEAKRAAEKAQKVARIDERVKMAIASANKAANAARVAAIKAVQNQMHHNNVDNLSTRIA